MVLVTDVLLVHYIGMDSLAIELSTENVIEALFKISTISMKKASGVLSKKQKLSEKIKFLNL